MQSGHWRRRAFAGGPLLATVAGCAQIVGANFDHLVLEAEDAGEGGPVLCRTGGCVTPPSCGGLPANCGLNADQDCCKAFLVPGGAFLRDNKETLPAHISPFALDAYEVTAGRFRSFVTRYPNTSWPVLGAGAHPKWGAETGWQQSWDSYLPATLDLLTGILVGCKVPSGWRPESGMYENLPVACIGWYLAFAFCAWDGGRLPTEAEWNFAAVGGNEQRVYPWSNPPGDPTIGQDDASYDCAARAECGSLVSLIPVGSRPRGNGRWGHSDLAGNLWEWTFDTLLRCEPADGGPSCPFCDDCINGNPSPSPVYRIARGGGFQDPADALLLNKSRTGKLTNAGDFSFQNDLGFRCARDP